MGRVRRPWQARGLAREPWSYLVVVQLGVPIRGGRPGETGAS